MNKLRAVLIDDEPDAIEVMEWMLKNHSKVEVVGAANEVDHGIDLIKQLKPDVVFLDIEMPQKNGFDLLDAFDHPNFKVVFVTGYDHYAIKAIKYAAIDYILKPIDKQELDIAIDKVESLLDKNDNRIEHLKNLYEQKGDMDRIIITSKNGFTTIFLRDIISIESKPGNYALFYTKDKGQLLCTKPLKYYDELFPSNTFYRIHRSFIVNLDCISNYDNHTGEISLVNDKKLEVAFRRRSEFNQLIKEKFSS